MVKVALFDVDGVAIATREKYFSQRLSQEYKVPQEKVMSLFKNEFPKCLLGQLDLKEELRGYLPKWGWKNSVDSLLQYWWSGENKQNTPVLEIIDGLRKKGIKCYLASDQEKNRANYLMEEVGLKNHFDGAFFSCDLGVGKGDKRYWESVLKTLGENPESVVFWDDDKENVKIASETGISGKHYTDFEDLKEWAEKL